MQSKSPPQFFGNPIVTKFMLLSKKQPPRHGANNMFLLESALNFKTEDLGAANVQLTVAEEAQH